MRIRTRRETWPDTAIPVADLERAIRAFGQGEMEDAAAALTRAGRAVGAQKVACSEHADATMEAALKRAQTARAEASTERGLERAARTAYRLRDRYLGQVGTVMDATAEWVNEGRTVTRADLTRAVGRAMGALERFLRRPGAHHDTQGSGTTASEDGWTASPVSTRADIERQEMEAFARSGREPQRVQHNPYGRRRSQ